MAPRRPGQQLPGLQGESVGTRGFGQVAFPFLPAAKPEPSCGPQTPLLGPGRSWLGANERKCKNSLQAKEGSRPPRASRLDAAPTSRPSWTTGEEGRAEELLSMGPEGQRMEGVGGWVEGGGGSK